VLVRNSIDMHYKEIARGVTEFILDGNITKKLAEKKKRVV